MHLGPVRGRQEENPLPVGVVEPAEPHVLPLSHQRRDSEAVGHRLPKAGEVGLDPVGLLAAAARPAEAGDHFVEHEESALGVGEIPQRTEKATIRLLDSGRFENDGGDAPRMAGEHSPDAFDVVVAKPTVSACTASGTPAFMAVVPMNQSSVEKKG